MRQTKLIKRIGATLLAGVSVVSLMTSSFASASDSSVSTIKDSRIQTISSSDFLEPSDLDTLHIRLEDFPEIRNIEGTGTSMNVLSGTEKGAYSGLGGNKDDAANIKQKYITIVTSPSASVSDFEDVSFEAFWEDAGTLGGKEISMSIKYSNIVAHDYGTGEYRARFSWTQIDSSVSSGDNYPSGYPDSTAIAFGQRTHSEWGRHYVESNDIEVTFYYKGSTTPITFQNAYMTSYSLDGYDRVGAGSSIDSNELHQKHYEGRSSTDATAVYVLEEKDDGELNVKDMSKVYKYINKTGTLTAEQFEIADVTLDGKVNVKDYSKIYKHINKTALLW